MNRSQVHFAHNAAWDADLHDNSQLMRAGVTERTPDPLATIEQHVDAAVIARRLGCTAKHIREEMTSGSLPYLRIGRKRVVPISAVETYVAERAIGAHPARRASATVIGFPSPRRTRTA
jgi:excisionase family DNA binding protein